MRLFLLRSLSAALVLVPLLTPAALGQVPPPIAPAEVGGQRYATPFGVAFQALERIRDGDTVPDRAGGTLRLTRDQMMLVSAYVGLAQRVPDLAASSLEKARATWDAASRAYSGNGYYHVTLQAESICIQLETNAWALQASMRLQAVTGDPAYGERARAVAQTLTSALTRTTVNGVELCPAGAPTPASQWPLVLWTLLLYANHVGDASIERAAVSRLRSEASAHVDGGFRDSSGVRLAGPSAQYLLAFGAAQEGGNDFSPQAEALLGTLAGDFVASEGGGLVVYNLLGEAGEGSDRSLADLDAAIWVAYALHLDGGEAAGGLGAGAPQRLLDSLYRRHYSPQFGGLVGGSQLVETGVHGLLAALTTGPVPTDVQVDPARLLVAMPSVESLRFPLPGQEGAERLLVSNEWSVRFNLAGLGTDQRVVLPVDALAPVNFGFPVTRYTPSPQLFREGEAAPAQFGVGRFPVAEFDAAASGAGGYRLQAYAPVFPEFARLARNFQVFFVVNGTGKVPVGSLQIDLPVTQVSVFGVSIDNRPLLPAQFSVQDVGPTEFMAQDHLRVQVRDIELASAARTEVIVDYEDAISPNVTSVRFFSDASGQRPLSEEGSRLRTGPQGEAYVRAEVTDNAVVRRVLLVVGQGLNTTEVAMTADPARPGVFQGVVRGLPLSEATPVRVRAVDEHGNLKESETFQVQAQSGFLAEGNLILLVFSGLLMVMAAAIYVKMGRKRPGR